MPSGRSHDLITAILSIPTAGIAYSMTKVHWSTAVITTAFLFGGLVFGPDLDTVSRPYARWGIFRFLWIPYRKFFSHRSRYTHGLIFGPLLRVIYFVGVITLAAYIAAYIWTIVADGELADLHSFTFAWNLVVIEVRRYLGEDFLFLSAVGIWIGSAIHSMVDIAFTYIKSGRIGKVL